MSVQLKNFSEALLESNASKIHNQQVLLTEEELNQVEQFLRARWTAQGNTGELQTLRKLYRPNELIFNRGNAPDAIYFVVSGQVLCFIDKVEGYHLALDKTPPLGFFGEVATIGYRSVSGELQEQDTSSAKPAASASEAKLPKDLKRTASARALTDTTLLQLPEAFLDEFIAKHPQLFRKIASGMVERLYRSARDLHDARLRDDALEKQQTESTEREIHAHWMTGIGSYWFLVVFAVIVGLWFWTFSQYQWDKNIQWFPLWLSIVQIVIGTLVLKSQLHLAAREAGLQKKEREANFTAEEEINTVALELREQLPLLLEETKHIKDLLSDPHRIAVASMNPPRTEQIVESLQEARTKQL